MSQSSFSFNEEREKIYELNHESSKQEMKKLGQRVSNVALPANLLDKKLPSDIVKSIFNKDRSYTPVLIAPKSGPALKKKKTLRRFTMIVSESTTGQTIDNVNERRQEVALKKAKTYLEKKEPI